ncbi:MAG: hypothetical protein EOP09_14780 [Proteobacteria bacterium]|nr:MAG: hypothetical protein EOP09_14780 [Pseudomonadota bacterium]
MDKLIHQKSEQADQKRPIEDELDSHGLPQSENRAKGGHNRASLGGGKVPGDAIPADPIPAEQTKKDRSDEEIQETNAH